MPTTFANTINGDEILAKRSQCDYAGNDIQTTYATKSELPTATSQLTNDSGFITSVAFPVTDVQVDGTSVVNANGVAEVDLSNYATTQALTNGLAAKQDVISDLATIRSGAALGATAVQQADLAPYATTSAMNAALADKQDTLTAGTNVSISNNVISATDTTYTAGTGIEISNNEISVETPVDIVAGPGIVVDNPDGNTLRVSTDENYEVELYYSPTNHNVATNAEFAMSESIWNFSKVLITFDNMEFENRNCTMLIDLAVANTGTYFSTPYVNGDTPGTVNICWASFNINAAGNIKYLNRGLIYGTWTAPAFTTGTSRGYRVKRVVGINRINGGN